MAQALNLLQERDMTVLHVKDIFVEKERDDVVYLPAVGQLGLFLVTRDLKQRKKPAEVAAYKSTGSARSC